MWLEILAILGGIAVLVWAADRFITGAAALARNLGVAPLIIGLTVVGLGTSAPEILVSATATLQGNPALAVGNAVGSNIANLGLILGATALITPLQVHSGTLQREYPLVLGVSLLALALVWDGVLGRLDGLFLAALLVIITLWMVHIARQGSPGDPLLTELEQEIPASLNTGRALFWLIVGLLGLLASSRALVWGAVELALAFGVSDLIIGLTIVAIGTSLPELAASLAGALKNEHDIAIGNVLGSNLYNLLAVYSLPGLIAPGPVNPEVVNRDLPVMLVFTVAIFLMSHRRLSPCSRINRYEGLLLLVGFGGYQLWLYRAAVS
jgi:cation:H+ antiporter